MPGYKNWIVTTQCKIILEAGPNQTLLIIPSEVSTDTSAVVTLSLPTLFADDTEEDLVITLKNTIKNQAVEVLLDQKDVYFMEMTLPNMAKQKLKDAVSYQLIREFPLDRKALYFDSKLKRLPKTIK